MERIDSRTWDMPVAGHNLRSDKLGAEIGSEMTLLVFLRHLG